MKYTTTPVGIFSVLACLVINVHAAPTLDGIISGGEGWIHLTEDPYALPVTGGQTGSSDFLGEVSSQHLWDHVGNADIDLGSNRGDIRNIFIQWDANNLYLGLQGPTVPFRDWTAAGANGEQGDVYIAIDTRGGTADTLNDYVVADDGHKTFHDTGISQAIDFFGWEPTHILGVDWVDNTDFTPGDGYANIEEVGTHNVNAAEGHGLANGGFDWAAGFDGTHGGVFEFALAWADIGMSGPNNDNIRIAAYTTADFDEFDAYDSGPGTGQGVGNVFEEIGDNPGDLDTGFHGDDTPQLEATRGASDGDSDGGVDDLSINGSFPGSNYVNPTNGVNDYTATPGPTDEIDTIQGYLSIKIVPEPGTLSLLAVALGMIGFIRHRRK